MERQNGELICQIHLGEYHKHYLPKKTKCTRVIDIESCEKIMTRIGTNELGTKLALYYTKIWDHYKVKT